MSTFYGIMSYGGLALAAVLLIVTVIIFFQWNMPKIFGDLSGSTKRKAMKQIREEGYHVSSRGHKMNNTMEYGEIEHIHIRKTSEENESSEAETIALSSEAETSALFSEADTTSLKITNRTDTGENTTMVLKSDISSPQASMQQQDGEITSVLTQAMGGFTQEVATTLLRREDQADVIHVPPEKKTKKGEVESVLNLVVVHTDEVVRVS